MALRLMIVTALSLGIGAAVVGLWPEAPAERVASRAEVMAAHAQVVAQPAAGGTCGPAARTLSPRAPAEI